jgi:hypothetical protein
MFVIGSVPKKLNKFFENLRPLFEKRQWPHFYSLVLAIAVAHGRRNIAHLNLFLQDQKLRQRRQDFLVESPWDAATVVKTVAFALLDLLDPKDGELLEVILDGSHTAKRGKTMEGAQKYFDPVTKSYRRGHAFVLCILKLRGTIIPWAVVPWVSKNFCKSERGKELKVRFRTSNQIAGDIIRELPRDLTRNLKVRVLFDSGFLNEEVVGACRERGFEFISVAKSNRVFFPKGYVRKRTVASYGPGLIRTEGKAVHIRTERGTAKFRAAVRDGYMRGIGEVRTVFSKRQSDGSFVSLVTSDRTLDARGVILGYRSRWSIEVTLKNLKQYLGLGDYQTARYEGFMHHLHLCLVSYSLLTTLGIGSAKRNSADDTALEIDSIPTLQDRLRCIVAGDHMGRFRRLRSPRQVLEQLRSLMVAA